LETVLDKWVYFLKNAADLEVIPANADTPALQSAYEVANRFGWTAEELEAYDYWGMKAQDARGSVEVARQEGWQEGHQEGRQEGHQEGAQSKSLEIARKMLAKGHNLAEISELTGLSVAELSKIEYDK